MKSNSLRSLDELSSMMRRRDERDRERQRMVGASSSRDATDGFLHADLETSANTLASTLIDPAASLYYFGA